MPSAFPIDPTPNPAPGGTPGTTPGSGTEDGWVWGDDSMGLDLNGPLVQSWRLGI